MALRIEQPPALTGSTESALGSLYGYLFRMAETLNVALEYNPSAPVGGSSPYTGEAKASESLRGLIVNTADIIRREMAALEDTLRSEYEAVSAEWGTYREEITRTVTETAEAVVHSYGYEAEIEALQREAAGFERYRLQSEGFIRQGFVERDENGVPVVGIAIGQGLRGTEKVVDGQQLLELDANQSCAFYTAERVSFRMGGREVAYVSNRRLCIADAEVGSMKLGGCWLLEGSGGLTVKWVG